MAQKKLIMPLTSQESRDFDEDDHEYRRIPYNESELSMSNNEAVKQDEPKKPTTGVRIVEDEEDHEYHKKPTKKSLCRKLGTHWRFLVAYLAPFILAIIPLAIPGEVFDFKF